MPFERSRLSGALGIALGMACLAMLAAFSMKVDFLFAGLTGVYLLLLRLLVIVFALLFSPFLLLMYFFIPYLGSRIPGLPLTQKLMELVLDMQKLFSGLEPEGKPWFLDRQQLVLWASLLFVFLLALLLAYRLWSKRSEQDSGLQGAGLVLLSGGEDWLGLLRKGLGGLPSRLGNFAAYGPGHRRRAAARIRQIYAELMDLSARLGQARPGSQTPLEFQPALQDLFSGLAAEISTITQAYVRVRYGQVPESAQELQAVENAWSRIAKEGRQKIRMNKRRPVKPGASMMR